ncbi:hypothetical protein BHU72_14220 [Desulfuribacillus stibiiarsenatis]|uniref:Uncharacterized protein n=1 Tax=Desulfuribacillus stibiiarsenatis TaxID=1390249 RepID=A0A1E5L7F4_9FIRM|nr:hypothetical protein [Desulfuribacillus stibiiarsenatis]OEH86080.1 hypothetical protein BHU72_14220 [Desulfuribacillus stibiiarsenatis]
MYNILEGIKRELSDTCGRLLLKNEPDNVWTKEILSKLVEIGNQHKYVTCASVKNATNGEWMYDVSWLKYSSQSQILESVELVAESEWGNEQRIMEDYEKLIQSKAKYKIMIMQCKGLNHFEIIRIKLKESACLFRGVTEESYLLAAFIKDKFYYDEFIVV